MTERRGYRPALDGVRGLAARVPLLGRSAARARQAATAVGSAPGYLGAWRRYSQLPHAERLRLRDAQPHLTDAVPTSPYDAHYLQQSVWAGERIFAAAPTSHIDVGSELVFVGMLATRLPVTFIDLRPLDLEIAQLKCLAGDILNLPFDDRTVESISSLHVVEHIGLGRYGDDLNPLGTRDAITELARVVAANGSLYLSLPVGRPRVCFNAHRITAPAEVLELATGLTLKEFSFVDDAGKLHLKEAPDAAADLAYGCGLFHFIRD